MAALRSHNNDFGFLLLTIFVVIASELTGTQAQSEPSFPPASEVEALKEIGKELGIQWNFTQNPCSPNSSSWNAGPPILTGPLSMFNRTLSCNCSSALGPCHVVGIYLRGNDLPGVLPRSITKLPYLNTIDLHGNYLNGTIPQEWTSTKLEYVFVSVNRLSGPIPSYIANMTFLRCLSIEGNFFTGTVPPELGKLANLECLSLCTNFLTGTLPPELTKLTKLTDLRISGNNFSGRIPDIFQNWKQLQRLEIQASGLEAPIPASIATLANLTILWISDLNGGESEFPNLENMTMMSRLMLRNCNISGQIPSYISKMTEMQILDLSFNRLEGQIPNFDGLTRTVYMYFTHNLLSGSIPDWIKARNSQYNIDLSYNNFSESSEPPSCQQNINLFRSSSKGNDSLSGACRGDLITCSKDLYSVNINCGGPAVTSSDGILYEADQDTGGAAKYVRKKETWGTSSTGLFWDNKYSDQQLIVYNVSTISGNNSGLYTSARASPLSLTYYFRCLADGNYTVTLHFAEIVIRDNRSFYSLGRRIFDVYVHEQLQLPDFNIKNEAQGVDTPIIRKVKTVVKDGTLTARFHWAGKGTTAAPERGTYGPLISAISVDSDFKPLNLAVGHGGNAKRKYVVAAVVTGSCLIFLLLGAIIWWRRSLGRKMSNEEVLQGLDLQSGLFTYRQIKAATNNFDPENKIGEGGFGAVYKGVLLDGTLIAVKQLSSKSKQGNQEFVNEMGIVSGLQHPNLVRLYGCCIERNELLLVYEYMENNCLGRALFGPRNRLKLDWPTRQRICVGIAKGLAFLHEESRLKIVHRDIKVTNVLLDGNLNAKISDFGLAKLDEVEKTHISTRIAGTIGYMAPEYALWGRLTYKADIYSFGVVALEIVAGKNNMKFEADDDYVCLQDWALVLQQKGKLMDLVDPKLGTDFNREEAVRMIKVALLCTNPSPSLRPIMSSVVRMLEGKLVVPELIMDPTVYGDESRFRALRDQLNQIRPQEEGETQHLIQSSMDATGSVFTSSASADDF